MTVAMTVAIITLAPLPANGLSLLQQSFSPENSFYTPYDSEELYNSWHLDSEYGYFDLDEEWLHVCRHSLDNVCFMHPCHTLGHCIYTPVSENSLHDARCRCTQCLEELDIYFNDLVATQLPSDILPLLQQRNNDSSEMATDLQTGDQQSSGTDTISTYTDGASPEGCLSTATTSTRKLISCDYQGCQYSTTNKTNLTRHKRTHSGERPYHCDHSGCRYSAATKSRLVDHKRVHSEERAYQCKYSECKYSTNHRSSLIKHKRVHDTEKPLSVRSTKVHVFSYYRKKPKGALAHPRKKKHFRCDHPDCQYSAARKSDLTKHQRTHRKTNRNSAETRQTSEA